MAWPSCTGRRNGKPVFFTSFLSPTTLASSLSLSLFLFLSLCPRPRVVAMTFSVEAEDDEGTATTFKLFGSSIAFFGHSQDCQLFIDKGRSGRKDVVASMAGSCSESPFGVLDGVKVSKEGAEDEEDESSKGATICININGNREEPDKLLLPCPRCKSLDTKFCYFNNYSVKQPRHFCKKCQRYWTAGGTQRNVPVGSGRRKSKHYSSSASYPHPHHFLNPTDSLSVTSDALDSAQHSPVSPPSVTTTCFETGCSSLSAFGTPKPTFIPSNQEEAPFCQVLPANGRIDQHVAGRECNNGSCETYASNELQLPSPPPLIDELACSSSVGAQNFSLKEAQASKQPTKGEPFASAGLRGRSHFSFLMGPRPNGYGLLELNNNGGAISPSDLFSPWCDSGHPMNAAPAMASASSSCGADNPVLGKHPRVGLPTAVVNYGCLSTPKTMKIWDVEEATQSSIWSSLGLDNNMPK